MWLLSDRQKLTFEKFRLQFISSHSHLLNSTQIRIMNIYAHNSYLCNKLGKVIFFRTRCGIFNRDEVEIKNASSTKKTLFLRIAHMIFSTGVWKIHKIWIFLIYYPTSTRRHGNFAGVHTLLRILLSSNSAVLINIITGVLPPHFDFVVYYVLCQC
jgi:hypothetical protein